MSKYYETEQQVSSRHDRRDDRQSSGPITWFHRPTPGGNEVGVPPGEEPDAFVREFMTLTHSRPRSVSIQPNDWSVVTNHGRSRSRSSSQSRSRSRSLRGGNHDRSREGLASRSRAHSLSSNRAREIVEDNFTASTTGIGASIIGAVVGGFIANRASEALQNRNNYSHGHNHKRRDTKEDDANVPRIASTLLGAVAGGLGANVLANHIEDQHDRVRDRYSLQRRYSREEYDYRRSSRPNTRYGEEDDDHCEGGYDFVYDDYDGEHQRFRSRNSAYYRR